MKICVAQTWPVRGDIQRNIDHHKALIDLACSNAADVIVFPELSLTGYEPALAKELATTQDDSRFDHFQNISDAKRITIGVGMPTRTTAGICISMILFEPHKARQTYSKKYLHSDEEPFFISGISGQNSNGLWGPQKNIALAICYELSLPQHAEDAFKSGARIYIASVAKTAGGVENAHKTLSAIANKYSMTVLMSNCVGPSADGDCAGRSAAWNDQGALLGQLDDAHQGILILDTDTAETIKKTM